MDCKIEFALEKGLLCATITGRNDRDTFLLSFTRIGEQGQASGCRRVLIDERLSGPRMPLFDLYETSIDAARCVAGRFDAIAVVDPAHTDRLSLTRSIAKARALPIEFFKDMESARAWLDTRASVHASRNDVDLGYRPA